MARCEKDRGLNVAGPRASESPVIYDAVANIMKSVLHLSAEKMGRYPASVQRQWIR
jgi:hypothetical protein